MESNSVKAVVRVKGEELPFTEFQLQQCFFDHHDFVVGVDHKRLGENKVFSDPEQKLALIGETLTIDLFDGIDKSNSYTFLGRITDVRMQASAGVNGKILLIGKSDSVKMERGKFLQSFSLTNLRLIFNELTGSLANFPVSNKPRYTEDIEFSFQYFETDWEYLRRLSKIYHETLFWDGYKLVWGDYSPKTIHLTYDHDLKEVELSSKLISNRFEQYYHETDNKVMKKEESYSEPTFPGIASKKSDELNLMKKPLLPLEAPVTMKGNLDNLTKARKLETVNQMVTLTGSTKVHKVTIGCLVNVKLPKEMDGISLGTYRVTHVTHCVNEIGEYRNQFTGIPASSDYIPCPDFPTPVAQTLQATVTDNVDSDQGLGRIQIQFPFEKKACYHWFKRLTPDAGMGVHLGRGYVFVPEVGDEILISFMDGNPEKLFVLGSVFHARNAEALGGTEQNNLKTIITRSGHTIEFNDSETAWGITIKDIKGNCIHLDTNGKSIRITAPEKISIESKDIEILATNQLVLSSEKDTQQKVGTEFNQSVGDDAVIAIGKNMKTTVDAAMQLTVRENSEVRMDGQYVQNVGEGIRVSAGEKIEVISQHDMTLKSGRNVYIADN